MRVLEVGCGNGANLWFLTFEGYDAFGIDASQAALDVGQAQSTMRPIVDAGLGLPLPTSA